MCVCVCVCVCACERACSACVPLLSATKVSEGANAIDVWVPNILFCFHTCISHQCQTGQSDGNESSISRSQSVSSSATFCGTFLAWCPQQREQCESDTELQPIKLTRWLLRFCGTAFRWMTALPHINTTPIRGTSLRFPSQIKLSLSFSLPLHTASIGHEFLDACTLSKSWSRVKIQVSSNDL